MNKRVLVIVLAIIVVLGGGYYFYQNSKTTTPQQTGPITITHELGTAEFVKQPENIVVFDYGTLDILDSLGVEVKGVAKSNLPTYLSKYNDDAYTDIGTLFEPNYEVLAKLQPDAIFISGRQKDAYEQLSEIAPTVYSTIDSKDYMGSFTKNVDTVAQITNKEKEAKTKVDAITKSVEALNKKATEKKATALILLTNQGKISAYGPESRFGIIHNTFGVLPVDENIEASTHGQSVTYEYVVEKDPDYLFVVDRNKVIGSESGDNMFENDLMKNTKVYKENHIVFLDQEAWYLSTGGIQSTEKMISEVDAALK